MANSLMAQLQILVLFDPLSTTNDDNVSAPAVTSSKSSNEDTTDMATTTTTTDAIGITAPTTLVFHTDFDSVRPKYQYPIIIQANNNTCFRFCFDILSVYSTFFAHLKTLQQPALRPDDPANDHLVPLPAATPTAVHTFLTILSAELELFPLPPFSSLDDLGWTTCRDLLVFADAYEVDTLRKLVVRHFEMDTLTQFAFAAAADDQDQAVALSRDILILPQAHDSISHPFPQTALDLLHNMAPNTLGLIDAVLAERIGVWGQTHRDMKFIEPMVNGTNAFTKACLKRGGCSSCRLVGFAWESLRNRAANAAWKAIREMAALPYEDIEQALDESLQSAIACGGEICERCRYRLSATFTRAIRRQYKAMPRSL